MSYNCPSSTVGCVWNCCDKNGVCNLSSGCTSFYTTGLPIGAIIGIVCGGVGFVVLVFQRRALRNQAAMAGGANITMAPMTMGVNMNNGMAMNMNNGMTMNMNNGMGMNKPMYNPMMQQPNMMDPMLSNPVIGQPYQANMF
jgi:hypothetical protein